MILKLWTSPGLLVLVLLLLTSRADGSPYQREIRTESTKDVPYTCGTRPLFPGSLQKSTKILGGHDAAYGSNPWQANLYAKMEVNSGASFACGGTILNEYWVLTAGHCIDLSAFRYFIIVGDNYLGNKIDEEQQPFQVEKFILHEEFLHIPQTDTSNSTIRNDIALMKIKPKNGRGIQFGNYVQPACLPDADTKLKSDQNFTISGWGMTRPNAATAGTLQETMVTLNDTDGYCTLSKNYNPDLMLCAPTLNNNTCSGDSGGPLVANVNGVYQVFGVTSYGLSPYCKFPSVGYFTKVQAYLDWIDSNIINNSKNDDEKFLPSGPTFLKIM